MSLKSKVFIVFGIYSLIGIYLVKKLIFLYNYGEEGIDLLPIDFFEIFIFVIALIFVVLAIITAYILAKRNKEKVSKKLKTHILIPLIIGFIVIFFLIASNLHIVVPVSLLICGLILLNLNRIKIGNYNFLAVAEIILAVVSILFNVDGLIFLAFGSGILPILFGLYSYKKV